MDQNITAEMPKSIRTVKKILVGFGWFYFLLDVIFITLMIMDVLFWGNEPALQFFFFGMVLIISLILLYILLLVKGLNVGKKWTRVGSMVFFALMSSSILTMPFSIWGIVLCLKKESGEFWKV